MFKHKKIIKLTQEELHLIIDGAFELGKKLGNRGAVVIGSKLDREIAEILRGKQ